MLGIDMIADGKTKETGPQPWNAIAMDIAPPINWKDSDMMVISLKRIIMKLPKSTMIQYLNFKSFLIGMMRNVLRLLNI